MSKKVLGYSMISVGILSFLIVGGGSMRYRNKSVYMNISIRDGLLIVLFYILTPIIGFFLIKYGLKLIENKD